MKSKILLLVLAAGLALLPAAAWAANVSLSVSSNSGIPGDTNKEISIGISDVTGLGVDAVQLELDYSTAQLSFASITTVGTIAQPWGNPTCNANNPGRLLVSMFGIEPLSGGGPGQYLLKVNFNIKPDAVGGTSTLPLLNVRIYCNGVLATTAIQNGEFTVVGGNNPPVLAAIGPKSVNEGSALVFNVSATDPDQDTLTFSASGLPSGASFDPVYKTFSWIPGYSQAGIYNVTFSVDDGNGGVDLETVVITVNNTNRVPVANSQSLTVVEDGSLNVTLTATDADADSLSFSVVTAPLRGALSGTAPNLTYIPAANYNGSDSFAFKANDGKADSNIATVSITVTPVNDAPVLAAISAKTVNEGSLLTFSVSATDIDSASLSYSASNLPAGASFDPASRIFSWTPDYSQAGTYNVTFSVSDGQFSDSKVAAITVVDVPLPMAPAAPSGLTGKLGGGKLPKAMLTWVDNSGNETGFKVERSSDGLTFTQIAAVGANILTYSDTAIAKGAKYYYRVKAYNSVGDSAYSNVAEVAPATKGRK